MGQALWQVKTRTQKRTLRATGKLKQPDVIVCLSIFHKSIKMVVCTRNDTALWEVN
jgi:hypothetical protein